jgi:SAM-dependent methyltransferase
MIVHPITHAPLGRVRPGFTGTIRAGDDAVFVVHGVPIAMPDPVSWCAQHRDAIIAAVARDGGDVSPVVVALDALVRDARVTPAPFVDDFTPEESRDAPPPRLVDAALEALLDESETPLAFLAREVPSGGVIVEVGPGAGGLTALLQMRAKRRFVVIDHSLRAVLLARRAGGRRAIGLVADAAALPLADGAVDVLVAQNVVDILDDADAFFAGATRALRRGGVLALTTPGPALDGQGDVDTRLKKAGFAIERVVDGLRWPRVHGPRHVELWTCRGLLARRR